MKKFEAYASAAVWMAVSLLMTAAALEPVEAKSHAAPETVIGSCADGSPQLAMGCASIHL